MTVGVASWRAVGASSFLRASARVHRALGATGTALMLALPIGALSQGALPAPAAPEPVAEDCTRPGPWDLLAAAAPPDPAFAHAQAVFLDARHLRWPQGPALAPDERVRLVGSAQGRLRLAPGEAVTAHDLQDVPLTVLREDMLPPASQAARPHVRGGLLLALPSGDALRPLLRSALMLVVEDPQGRVRRATGVQLAAALDALHPAAAEVPMGAGVSTAATRFGLWAPTAQRVALCLFDRVEGGSARLHPAVFDAGSGAWSLNLPARLHGRAYTWLVDVHQPGRGLLRHRVTDPWSTGLSADSARSVAFDLADPSLAPPGWADARRPAPVQHNAELSIYELHVRDFSASDPSVPPALRGTYAAFTRPDSHGMRHLRRLARAGVTDLHLLPVFDIATIPERGCAGPSPQALQGTGESPRPQAVVTAAAAGDCFNWGYDPWHFGAVEGSYATDAGDPVRRIVEFRAMVQSLHALGLRVGMDVVYNHTSASGDDARSVLDRVVPGYYHRLDADGRVERSTCCENTATEHRMMERLMIDTAVVWARDHRIDGFRFDLMGHQPRGAMERLQRAVDAASGRRVPLIGEGWNFGEVKDGVRFVQASQRSLPGSGIATFSDRARDAVRGGGCCDSGAALLQQQGWVNGLHHAPNGHGPAPGADTLARLHSAADLLRAGLAGTLADFALPDDAGGTRPLHAIDYAGQPAGYTATQGEVVNYVENHDNLTLFDLNALKLPLDTPPAERARVQVLALATTAFSQGIAYWHAGVELLRSKSGDHNSYDSGDWFNRIDWTLRSNHWGSGLPPERENRDSWPQLAPRLADARLAPRPQDIRFTRDAFLDLLRLRRSSTLFTLPDADSVRQRLSFPDAGSQREPGVVVGHLDGRGLHGARYAAMLYALNAVPTSQRIALPALRGQAFELHPVQRSPRAADPRPRWAARWDAEAGVLTVPGRTAVVFVRP